MIVRVLMARAGHLKLGTYKGDRTEPSAENMLRVIMDFEDGSLVYFTTAED